MIVMRLVGGLGNQMFQYAIGRYLSIKSDGKLFLDTRPFEYDIRKYELNIFKIEEHFASKKEIPFYQRLFKKKLLDRLWYPFQRAFKKFDHNYTIENPKHPKIHRGMYDFQERVLKFKKNYLYLEGFRQSEKYFKEAADIIKKDFMLRKPIDDKKISIG